MNVLVAGGTGFIGANLCSELVDRDIEVTALSRSPDESAVPPEVDTVRGDVSEYDSIETAVGGHDVVVNLVALSPLFQPPSGTSHETVTLEGTRNLVRAAEAGSVKRFVQMSALDADPDAPTAFLRTKGQAERVVRESSLGWSIVRPSVVFGKGGEFVSFTKLVTTPYVTGLPGGGRTPFQPIWVGDLAGMLAEIVSEPGYDGSIYELGGPDILTLADVTKVAYAAAGTSVRIVPIPMALAKVALTVLGPVPFVPFGPDQARALEVENTVSENDVSAFGINEADLTPLPASLGLSGDDLAWLPASPGSGSSSESTGS